MWSFPDDNSEDRSSVAALENTNSDTEQQQSDLPNRKSERSCHIEYNMDNSRVFRGRKRGASYGWHKFHRRNNYFEHRGYMRPSSKFQENNENMAVRDTHEDSKVTYSPYPMRLNRRRIKYSDGDEIVLNVWKDKKPDESKMVVENGTLGSWFKVTIPNGRKYDKIWLMNAIQGLCSVPFITVDFHYDKNRARFFVQDIEVATALKDVSYKICDETNQKIPIFVSPSVVPYSVQNKFTSEQMDQLKMIVMKRYDSSQKALDLQKFRFDRDLLNNDIDMMLNRRSCMVATLQIIQSNIPEVLALNLCNNKLYQLDGLSDVIEKAPQVKILNLSKNKLKSVWELEKVKELNLEELWLDGNPFCSNFTDQSAYISAVRDLFPKLLRLDGMELIVPTGMDIEDSQLSKGTCKDYELIKNLILQFLKEYYLFYDNGDRLRLLDAYHDEACFSLAIPMNFDDPDMSNFEDYLKYSRNLKKLQDSYMQVQLLKHTKHDIVNSLNLLPKTQHDLYSFWVDLCCYTETMLCFSVNGVFKEVEGKCQGCVRAFTRIFITAPCSDSRICITNDELVVRNATPREIQNAFISLPIVSTSSKTPLSEEQQEMVKSFSMQSGMKTDWSQKCLEDNDWDYTKAGEIFTILQNEGKIPKEFFK